MSVLTPDVRALVRLSGALAGGHGPDLDEALQVASRVAEPVEVEEALIQSYLFLGYPAALNALARWRELEAEVASEPVEDDWEAWAGRGREVCRLVYEGQYDRLRENVRALHPDMERWMVTEGYGKVLGRPRLSLAVRELCIAAILAVLGASPQLHSHLRGALNVGARPEEIQETLDEVDEFLDGTTRGITRDTWARVLNRRG